MDNPSPFSAVPPQNQQMSPQEIMDDAQLVQSIRYVLENLDTVSDQLNYLEMLHQRYEYYISQSPEEAGEYRNMADDVSRSVVASIVNRYDLTLMVDLGSLESDRLTMLARELYSTFVVHRQPIALEFLEHWLPLNFRNIYDFGKQRCHDVLYTNLKAQYPDIAPLLYKLRNVLQYGIFNSEPVVVPHELFASLMIREYSVKSMAYARMYFGIDDSVPVVTVGKNTARQYFDLFNTHESSEVNITNLYSRIISQNTQGT